MSEQDNSSSQDSGRHPVSTLLGADLEDAVWKYLWFHDGGRSHHVARRFKITARQARSVLHRLEKADRAWRNQRHSAVNDIYWCAKKSPADGPKGKDGPVTIHGMNQND